MADKGLAASGLVSPFNTIREGYSTEYIVVPLYTVAYPSYSLNPPAVINSADFLVEACRLSKTEE